MSMSIVLPFRCRPKEFHYSGNSPALFLRISSLCSHVMSALDVGARRSDKSDHGVQHDDLFNLSEGCLNDTACYRTEPHTGAADVC